MARPHVDGISFINYTNERRAGKVNKRLLLTAKYLNLFKDTQKLSATYSFRGTAVQQALAMLAQEPCMVASTFLFVLVALVLRLRVSRI